MNTDQGAELDAEIARRVFGFWLAVNPTLPDWEASWWGWHSGTPGAWVHASCAIPGMLPGHSYRYPDGLPKFSTDNDAALAVIAAFARRHVNVSLYTNHGGVWFCFFGPTPIIDHLKPRHEARERTMPEAICRAALLAIDLEVVPWHASRAAPTPAMEGQDE